MNELKEMSASIDAKSAARLPKLLLRSTALLGAALIASSCGEGLQEGGNDNDVYSEGVQMAASVSPGRKCATRDLSETELAQARTELSQYSAASVTPHTITVYFHVVRKGSGLANGDIPDSQVQAQIDVLNKAYASSKSGLSFKLAGVDRTTNSSWYGVSPDTSAETNMKSSLYKGGAVTTHIRIARSPADIHAVRIAAGEADLVLGCDMVVVNDYWVLSKIRPERSTVVMNTYEAMPGTFTTRPDMQFPAADIVKAVSTALNGEAPLQIDATQIATALMGDAIAANLFMLGYAWQQGLVPISFEALMRAIELNGAAVEMNKTAFAWGRLAVVDLGAVIEAAGIVRNAPTAAERTALPLPMLGATNNDAGESGLTPFAADLRSEDELRHVPANAGSDVAFLPLDDARLSRSLDEVIARRVAFLTEYQSARYAKRYSDFVAKVRAVEAAKAPGSTDLSEAVARYFFKLMAYKDEYEVARLYTSGDFKRRLQQQFEGDYTLHFHLAPPLLAKKNAQGQLVKKEYGSWVFTAFRVMAKLRGLRGTPLDVFGYTAERRGERALIGEYEKTVSGLFDKLDAGNVDLAADIASIPEHIRGYGHVKEAHLHKAKAREAELLREWDNPLRVVQAA